MKKNFLLLLVAIIAACSAWAQNSLVATLTHEGNVQMFYGSQALKNAHAAAVAGDVITLSSGTFEACSNITKPITLLGAGMNGSANGSNTVISGNFTIFINDENSLFTIEGIWTNNNISYGK